MVFIPLSGLFIIVCVIVAGANLSPDAPPPRRRGGGGGGGGRGGGGGGQFF